MNESSGAPRRCRKCGAELGSSMGGSHCPSCLFSLAIEPLGPPPAAGTTVKYVGDYELIEEIGRGGMGIVYRARQRSLNRILAVKMLLHGEFSEKEACERFRREAQAAARLRHANIVPIHELGEHEGLLYFSMDYIPGHSMAQALKSGPWRPQRIATCLRTVAEAVHAAHLAGVIHRDLKPANILLDPSDRPHLTDFGLAKLLDVEVRLTLTSDALGTPSYMAPEQADPGTATLTTAADIYSLGAILFHMLTGQPPYSGPTRMAVLRKVIEGKFEHPTTFNPEAPPELVALCLKCLSRDPEARPPSCQAIADELSHWLSPSLRVPQPPPRVSPPVSRPKLQRFLWFKKIAALSLFAGLAGLFWWKHDQGSHLTFADKAGVLAEAQARFDLGKSAEAMSILATELDKHRTNTLVAERLMSALMYRSWPRWVQEPKSIGSDLIMCQLDPEGKWLVASDKSGGVQMCNLATGQKVRDIPLTGGPVESLTIGPDNAYLLIRSTTNASVWTPDHQLLGSFASAAIISAVTAVPSKGLAFSTCTNHELRVWDLRSGCEIADAEARKRLPTHLPPALWRNCDSIEVTLDGRRALAVTGDKRAILADLDTGRSQSLGTTDTIVHRAYLFHSGNQVWIQDQLHRLSTWDLISGQPMAGPVSLEGDISVVAFSPDGERAATWIEERAVSLWNVRTGKVYANLELGSRDPLAFLRFSADGQRILTAQSSGAMRVWWTQTGAPLTEPFQTSSGVLSAGFANGSEIVVSLTKAGVLSFWDVGAVTALPVKIQADTTAGELQFSEEGTILSSDSRTWETASGQAFASSSNRTKLATNSPASLFVAPAGNRTLAVSRDARRALCMNTNSELRLWDTIERAPLGEAWRLQDTVKSAAFSPDSRKLAVLTDRHQIWLWTCPPQVLVAPDWLLKLTAIPTNGGAWLGLKPTLAQLSVTNQVDSWARWIVTAPSERSLAPGLSVTLSDKLERLLRETNVDSLEEVIRLAPARAEGWAQLAEAIYRQNPATRQRSLREARFFAHLATSTRPASLELSRLQHQLDLELGR